MISANKNNLLKRPISIVKNRKEGYIKVKRIYDNIKKELESIKNDTKVYIKSNESNISNICSIKRDTYYKKKELKYDNMNLCKINKLTDNINKSINYRKKKIDGIKIMKNKGNTKKQIDNLVNRLFDISDSLIYTNSLLNLYRKSPMLIKLKMYIFIILYLL